MWVSCIYIREGNRKHWKTTGAFDCAFPMKHDTAVLVHKMLYIAQNWLGFVQILNWKSSVYILDYACWLNRHLICWDKHKWRLKPPTKNVFTSWTFQCECWQWTRVWKINECDSRGMPWSFHFLWWFTAELCKQRHPFLSGHPYLAEIPILLVSKPVNTWHVDPPLLIIPACDWSVNLVK